MEPIIFAAVFILVVWILPIFACGHVAKSRNRSKAKGQLVGLLTGWPGFLVLYLMLKRRGTKPDGTFYLY